MQLLPDYIRSRFFKVLHGEEPSWDFEQWVYATNDLEKILSDEDYLNLISLDFSKQSSKYEIDKILRRYFALGEYETWKLRKLLTMVINKKGNLPQALSEFYKLYCGDGYCFLESLGLAYGLAVRVPPSGYSSNCWEELSHEEQSKLINSLLLGAIDEAQKVLSWLDEDKIVITSEQDELGHYLYIDRRTEEEKKPIWHKTSESSNSERSKYWWKFWK